MAIAKSPVVPALQEVRATFRVKGRDPAVLALRLLKEQHERTVELLDAYADAILARGADPASVCAIRDAADVLAGKLAFPTPRAPKAEKPGSWRSKTPVRVVGRATTPV